MSQVITRFPPSPTGNLHIGSARTALFNWLFARHHGGQFLLRIEDTDRARSTDDAVQAIFRGMEWLGLDYDGEAVSQFMRRDRHAEVAQQMLSAGHAYYCYCTTQELEEMREVAKAEGRPTNYDGRWRDRDPATAPKDVPPVIRLKAPREGTTTVHDKVQGDVTLQNTQLDDMILLRSDGTPTYMLSVVVDDYDMGVTHVIRGDDHFTNTFRQIQIYQAMGWNLPVYAHIPMILGVDGSKLSKRHGATNIEDYRDLGYLPEAMRNYLLRLGWSHGDDEIISTQQAIEWFDLDHAGKSPSKFDLAKLDFLNAHYIRDMNDKELAEMLMPGLEKKTGLTMMLAHQDILERALPELKQRAKTLNDLVEGATFLVEKSPIKIDDKAQALLTDDARHLLQALVPLLANLHDFNPQSVESAVKNYADGAGMKLGNVAQPLRAALTGRAQSPSVFLTASILGKDETLQRLRDVLLNPTGL